MAWANRFLDWFLFRLTGCRRRTLDDVLEELAAGIHDGTIVSHWGDDPANTPEDSAR